MSTIDESNDADGAINFKLAQSYLKTSSAILVDRAQYLPTVSSP